MNSVPWQFIYMQQSLFQCPRYELHASTVHSYAAVIVLLSLIWAPYLDSSFTCITRCSVVLDMNSVPWQFKHRLQSLFYCPWYELRALTVHSQAAVMVLLPQIWTPCLDSLCGCCSHWPPPIHGLLKCRQFTDMLQSWVLFHLWNPAMLPDHAHVAVIGLLTALHSKCCLVTHTIRYNTIQYNTIQLYCRVTNTQVMCYGTEQHSYTHSHQSHTHAHTHNNIAKNRSNKVKKVRLTFCVYSVNLKSVS